MNFLNLKYFCIAAEELSFTKAAKKLYISQQSLSNHISKLEEEFGVVLFNRTQPMTLTEAGHSLYINSCEILKRKSAAEKELQDLRDFRSGILTIGVSTSRGAVMLTSLLPSFHEKFPQVKIKLVEGTTKQITKALYDGKTDLNIGFQINDPDNIWEMVLHREHLMCVIPLSFLDKYLLENKSCLTPGTTQSLKMFESCPFIKMPSTYWLGTRFEQCCEAAEADPEIILETTSMTTMISLCSAGFGGIILPEIFLSQNIGFSGHEKWKESVAVYQLDYEEGIQPITISRLKANYVTRAAKEFIKQVEEYYHHTNPLSSL